MKSMKLSRQASISLAEKNEPLREYVESVRKKHEEDESYLKWDLKQSLPKLPVPHLRSTLNKYLRCILPIVDAHTYTQTKEIVEEFGRENGQGDYIQNLLLDHAQEKDNWAYDWWLDDMYMSNRLALPINSNPGMVFPKQNFKDENAYLKFTSKLISGIMDYKLIIDGQTLPIDRCTCREKGQPLCMEQYYRLFSSYRLPGVLKDKLVESHTNLVFEPEHVIVIVRNQIFTLDVIVNFTRLNEYDLYYQLKRIKSQVDEEVLQQHETNSHSDIGFLTTLSRDRWAMARDELMKDALNRDNLDLIERCIFVVCLDRANEVDQNNNYLNEQCLVEMAHQMLHGTGSHFNTGNRWFDKTMQFIISEDGTCGLNYEHSPSEGIAVIQLTEHLFKYMERKNKRKISRTPSMCELPMPRRLKWKLSEKTKANLRVAKETIDSSISNLDLFILNYTKFGKNFPKKIKMSPDCFIQLSMQLAYYNLYGYLVSTYESASTRRFRKGRVDNIRANSIEALEWVKAMNTIDVSNEVKFKLFQKAEQYQTDLMIQNILGQGMDCHLLALKRISEENGLGTPEMFRDISYKISNEFKLSTSQIPTTLDGTFMCYGPVVPDGYGCSYNPKSNNILFVVSSFRTCNHTSSKLFAESLTKSLDIIYDMCIEYAC